MVVEVNPVAKIPNIFCPGFGGYALDGVQKAQMHQVILEAPIQFSLQFFPVGTVFLFFRKVFEIPKKNTALLVWKKRSESGILQDI